MSLSCEADRRSARARSHTRLRRLLADRAAILHRDEHRLLLDAADALLFDESDALAKQASGQRLLAALVDNDRWLPDPAAEVRRARRMCRRRAGPARTARRSSRARERRAPVMAGPAVLVCDDAQGFRLMLGTLLSDAGFDV